MKRYGKGDRRVRAEIGETFAVELEAMPGAGYQWSARVPAGLRLVEEKFEPSSTIGGSSMQVFVLQCRTTGDASLAFEYGRPWEKQPSERLDVDVTCGSRKPPA